MLAVNNHSAYRAVLALIQDLSRALVNGHITTAHPKPIIPLIFLRGCNRNLYIVIYGLRQTICRNACLSITPQWKIRRPKECNTYRARIVSWRFFENAFWNAMLLAQKMDLGFRRSSIYWLNQKCTS